MKNLSTAVLAELQASGCKISTFIKLEVGTDTLYLSGGDKILSDGTSVTGRIVGYPSITSKVNWENSDIGDTGFQIELANQPTGTDWETLIEQLGSVDPHTIKVSVISIIAGEQVTRFIGFVERIDSYTEKTVTMSIRKGLSHLDTLFGTLLTNNIWGGNGVLGSANGLMMPLIWGKVENCPTIPVTGPWTGTLKYDLLETAEGWIEFENFEYTMATGTGGYFFIGEELIYYNNSDYANSKVCIAHGGRGYRHTIVSKAAHKADSKAIQWQKCSGISLLVAGHSVNSISDIKVAGQTQPSDDRDIKLSEDLTAGWGGKKAQITYYRNPSYPDTSGSTKKLEVYFSTDGSNNNVENIDRIIETIEGSGPPTDNQYTSSLYPWEGEDTLEVQIAATRDWEEAAKTLGTIKSVKLKIKTAVEIDDDPDTYGFQASLDPTDATMKCTVKDADGTMLVNAEDVEMVKTTGDAVTENILPSSVRGTPTNSHTEADGAPVWWENESKLVAENPTGQYCRGRLYHNAPEITDDGEFQLVLSFPTWKKYHTNSARFYLFYDVGWNSWCQTTITRSTNETSGLDWSNSLVSSVGSGKEYEEGFTNIEVSYGIKSVEITNGGFNGGPWLAGSTVLSLRKSYIIYNYTPTDYGTAKEQEFDLDVTDWAQLDGLTCNLHSASGTGPSVKIEIYYAYLEVEYYPYQPFTEQAVTCTVHGRTGPSYIRPEAELEHPGAVMRDIIENWLLEKTGLSGITIDTDSFEKGGWERYIDLRLDTRESIFTVLSKIAYQSRRWLTFNNLVFGLIRRPDTLISTDWTITDGDIIRNSFKIIPASVIDLVTDIDWKAQYNHADNTWGLAESLPPVSSDVGEKPQTIELLSHCQSSDATVPQYYLNMFSTKHDLYSFSVTVEGLKVEVEDIIDVTYSYLRIVNTKILVLSTSQALGNPVGGTAQTVKIIGVVI